MADRRTVVFTDLDGTLLDRESYRADAALDVLHELARRGIPVVPVTSKTRTEVLRLQRDHLPFRGPFIVENGSAIVFPPDDPWTPADRGEIRGQFRILRLGSTYEEAHRALLSLREDLQIPLTLLPELSDEEVQRLTGLEGPAIAHARAREFSEVFLVPPEPHLDLLRRAAHDRGFKILVGDRFGHLIGLRAGKGAAIRLLLDVLKAREPGVEWQTVGLGNSPNDQELLETTDHAVVIPGPAGPHPALTREEWIVAPAPGPEGWARAIQELLDL
ncbi:MAG: HAD-IIB family hydrolase [Candidatus Hydrothermae bacterium]|nr:HAD-IIB family hydrolase [Candidatus Hydrothermae bacterium]